MKLATNLGMMLLGIWLIITGAAPLLGVNVPGMLLSILAIVAGALILMNK